MSPICSYFDSPLGRLRLVAENDALVGVYLPGERGAPPPDGHERPDEPILQQASRQLEEYFGGRRELFDVPLRLRGTSFERTVWTALLAIPFASTRSYAELARNIGKPAAVRAVGAANGRNPLPIVVPCHRVIGSDGSLTGYGGGLEAKRWLLDHEARVGQKILHFA